MADIVKLNTEPLLCFPGWDLDGDYKLGNGRRVAKRLARLRDIDELVEAIEAETIEALKKAQEAIKANSAMYKEVSKLRPYLGRGLTKQEAIEAYLADHPVARKTH